MDEIRNKMNATIFDTETNGKIQDWNLPLNRKTLENFPRITQLAWEKVDLNTGAVVSSHVYMIKPDGWTIPTVEEQIQKKEKNPYFFVENNMSTERCEEEGIPLAEVMVLIIEDLKDSEIVVAHNMNFDFKVLGAEMFRLDMSVGKQLIKVCTMMESTDFCKIPPYRYGKYKWPQLVELYKVLFGEDMEGNHDAMFDVVACRMCFIRLIELKQIIIPE